MKLTTLPLVSRGGLVRCQNYHSLHSNSVADTTSNLAPKRVLGTLPPGNSNPGQSDAIRTEPSSDPNSASGLTHISTDWMKPYLTNVQIASLLHTTRPVGPTLLTWRQPACGGHHQSRPQSSWSLSLNRRAASTSANERDVKLQQQQQRRVGGGK